jgi:hypothetical protein
MVFLALAFFPYVADFSLFFLSFYVVGLFGSGFRVFFAIKNIINSSNKKEAISNFLKFDAFISAILLSVTLSFFQCSFWPSGELDILMTYSIDYYSWIFGGEYLIGGISPNVLDLSPANFVTLINNLDAFGTYVIIDYLAMANLKTPFLASSAIGLDMTVWAAAAIYCLLTKSFRFKPWLTFILTLGVAAGSLFNYVAIIGMFGHMTAMTAFLISLEQLCPQPPWDWPQAELKRRLFIPIFLIFISYQAGYILYCSLLSFFAALLFFYHHKNQPFFLRTVKSAILGVWPIALATVASGLLAPGIFGHFVRRSYEVAASASGWFLPFFSPWHFSGLPYYSAEAFQPGAFPIRPYDLLPYVPLAIAPLICLALCAKRALKGPPAPLALAGVGQSRPSRAGFEAISALTTTFFVSLCSYLALSLFINHSYKIWKFAAYSLLPLSFIPIALIFKVLTTFWTRKYPIIVVLIVIWTTIYVKFLSMPSVREFPDKYFKMASGREVSQVLQRIQADFPKSAIILIDFENHNLKWYSSFIFGTKYFIKVIFLSELVFINYDLLNFNLLNSKTFIISDSKYNKIFKSQVGELTAGLVYVYNYRQILEHGLASFRSGRFNFKWQVDKYPIYAAFLPPMNKRGQELKLSVDLARLGQAEPGCQKARLGFLDRGEIIWAEKEIDELSVDVPGKLTSQGTLFAYLTVPRNSENGTVCNFKINHFTLE